MSIYKFNVIKGIVALLSMSSEGCVCVCEASGIDSFSEGRFLFRCLTSAGGNNSVILSILENCVFTQARGRTQVPFFNQKSCNGVTRLR